MWFSSSPLLCFLLSQSRVVMGPWERLLCAQPSAGADLGAGLGLLSSSRRPSPEVSGPVEKPEAVVASESTQSLPLSLILQLEGPESSPDTVGQCPGSRTRLPWLDLFYSAAV